MDLADTVEFGDWINNELLKEQALSLPANSHLRLTTSARTADLENAKELLIVFLEIQDEMIQNAARKRQH